ncbi:MAG: acyl-CoA thioesterase [Oceanipulchritudo sp.]
MPLPPNPLTLERRVEFSQTDAAGLMHFSAYFTFMEAAEAELFRRLGLSLLEMKDGMTCGFPRVDCQCKFRRALVFEDQVTIEMRIAEILANRIHYAFTFLDPEGNLCARGSMTTACARRETDGSLRSRELPDPVRSALQAWKNQHP